MAVSKVLHGRGVNVRIGAATAENIRRVAEELDYRPNEIARNLRSKQTKTIGLVFDETPMFGGKTRYFSDLMNGVTRAAFALGYSVMLCDSLIGPTDRNRLFDGRFDGLMWVRMTASQQILQDAVRLRLPSVMFADESLVTDPSTSYVSWDNRGAAAQVAKHLYSLGHRKVGFVIGAHSIVNPEARVRAGHFRETWMQCGGEKDQVETLIWDAEATDFDEWYANRNGITALVSWSESGAIAILERARAQNIQVPKDLSVVGFDSSSHCDLTQPRLTAACQPVDEMAAKATEFLIRLIQSPDTYPLRFVFPSSLDIRESTASPVGVSGLEEKNICLH
jgi:LacI family transcriptional regulator